MNTTTCAKAGYCVGMYPPCMAECKLNDEHEVSPDDSDDCSGLMHWLGWIVLLLVSFWFVVALSFLAGYYSVEVNQAAASVWDFAQAMGYAVKTVNF